MAEKQAYVSVLQVVGNSILAQVNELSAKSRHAKDLAKAGRRELHAAEFAYSPDPHKFFDGLGLHIERNIGVLDLLEPVSEIQKSIDKLTEEIADENEKKETKEKSLKELESRLADMSEAIRKASDERDGLCLARKLLTYPEKKSCAPSDNADIEVSEEVYKCFEDGLKKLMGDTEAVESIWDKICADDPAVAEEAYRGICTEAATITGNCVSEVPTDEMFLMEKAETAFRSLNMEDIEKADSIEDALEKIIKRIEGHYAAARKEVAREHLNKTKLEKDKDTLKTAIASLKVTIDGKQADLKSEIRKKDKTEKEKKEAIQDVLRKIRPTVIAEIGEKDVPPTDASIKTVLISKLESKKEGKSGDEKSNLNDTIKLVNAYQVSPQIAIAGITRDRARDDKSSRKEVLDDVIAVLRHEHVKEVSRRGPSSERAKDIEAALGVLYEQRSGMVYIRPTSAYLRSSYPATSLQDDPRLAWRNMLRRHMKRASFGDSWLDSHWMSHLVKQDDCAVDAEIQRRVTQAEIDRQFWQNINSVRVAGGGRTNYVVAKDDIGNWYVKQYSADPQDITKSAQNLAMFNLGMGMDTDLLGRMKSKTEEDAAKKDPDATESSLERLFNKYEDAYAKQTEDDKPNVLLLLGPKSTLKADIEKFWTTDERVKGQVKYVEDLTAELNDSANNLESAYDDFTKKDPKEEMDAYKWGDRIATALHAIKRFNSDLSAGIRGIELPSEGIKKELPELEKKVAEEKQNLTSAETALAKATKKRDSAKTEKERTKGEFDKLQERLNSMDPADPEYKDVKRARDEAKDLDSDAATDLETAEGELTAAQGDFDNAKKTHETAEADYKTAEDKLEKAELAEKVAPAEAERIIKDELTKLLEPRQRAVNEFETAIMFIGEAKEE
jgi:hypothetical protein